MSTSANYIDEYIRRKRGQTPPATGRKSEPDSASNPAVEHHLERAFLGANQVQSFVDRSHALCVQVDAFEDKLINLTKLLKVSQSLNEERESQLKKENHELKVRLKRQEQLNASLQVDFEEFRQKVPQMIKEAVQPLAEGVQAVKDSCEIRINDLRSELTESSRTMAEIMINNTVCARDERLRHEISVSSQATHNEITALERRLEAVDATRQEGFRRLVEDRTSSQKEIILSEFRQSIRSITEKIDSENRSLASAVDSLEARLGASEKHFRSVEGSLTDFIQTFKDHAKLHAAKSEEAAQAMHDLMALHEQTRSVVATELENTKQWATRNMQRLKKHIDISNSDITALRTTCTELGSCFEKAKKAEAEEREKLSVLLAQKSREAQILTDMVDREIAGIHKIAKEHRPQDATKPPVGVDDVVEQYLQRSKARGETIHNLYDDLAFAQKRSTAH